MSTDTERLLAPSEAARMLGVHPRTVTRWAQAGKLTAIRTPGGIRRYRESEVRAVRGPTSRKVVRTQQEVTK